jgi:hypothetical protein
MFGTMIAAFSAALIIHLIFDGVEVVSKYGLITAIYTMLGTIYAVLIAFCISGVWQNFSASELAVTNEAAALNDLIHTMTASVNEKSDKVRQLAISYLKNVIDFEWDALSKGHSDLIMIPEGKTFQISIEIIREIQSFQPADARENVIFSHSLGLLSKWLDARRTRVILSIGNTAKSLWPLLITGALILFSFHGLYLFNNHALWITLLFFCSGIIGLSFYLIFTLDCPLTGSPSISLTSFKWALKWISDQKN